MTDEAKETKDEKFTIDDDKFKLLEFLARQAESEFDRSWRLYSFFLTINAALIAFMGTTYNMLPHCIVVYMSIFGFVLSVVWFLMIPISKYYPQRWKSDLEALIDGDDNLKQWIRAIPYKNKIIPKPSWTLFVRKKIFPDFRKKLLPRKLRLRILDLLKRIKQKVPEWLHVSSATDYAKVIVLVIIGMWLFLLIYSLLDNRDYTPIPKDHYTEKVEKPAEPDKE
jgi:hypothetical protein